MTDQLTLDTPAGSLEFTIIRRPRVRKRLHMELDADGGLLVVAPEHWSGRHISSILARNRSRVLRFVNRARERHLEPLQYVNGEGHLYLGKRFALKVVPVSGPKTTVTINADELCIETRVVSQQNIQAALQLWYRRQALIVFGDRLQLVSKKADWVRGQSISLKLRKMKRTWGNCSAAGVIKLNVHLVKAPMRIIDSVIAHELCHLKEMNHGKAFYSLLQRLNPDWRQDRATLKSKGHEYLL